MGRFFITIAIILALSTNVYSQTNRGINYQAVARDASGNLLENQNISVRFSILEDSPTGNMVYSESQIAMTNEYGLFTLSIGNGTILSGNFSDIDWSSGNIYLKVEIDENGGNNYKVIGTTKFMYVPYALYAEKSGSGGSSGDNDTDSTNEIQTLTKQGDKIILSNAGGSVTDSVDDADSDPTNEIQALSYSNDTLRLSGDGGEVVLSSGANVLNDLNDVKTDGNSIFVGMGSGDDDEGYHGNTALGIHSLNANTSGELNTANGYMSLFYNTTGNFNVAVGGAALNSNTSGDNNVAVGMRALSKNTTGYSNIAIGIDALYYNTTRGNLVAVGDSALYNNTAIGNTAIGSKALYSNTTGSNNLANGYQALYSNTTGFYNTAIGATALYSNTTGNNNTATGYRALYSNTTGIRNVAIGLTALYNNTEGEYNVATGNEALKRNTTGDNNVATGYKALWYNTTGYANTALGSYSLVENTEGQDNIAVGSRALGSNKIGNNNTAIGYQAYDNAGDYSNSSAFGYKASITASNQARIGFSAVTSIGGYAAWTNLSDGRYKYNLADDVKGLEFIMKLNPVTFQMDVQGIAEFLGENKRFDEATNSLVDSDPDEFTRKSREEKSQIRYSGFVAQEVEQVAKEVGYDFSGVDAPQNEKSLYGLRYAEFVVPLVKAMQEQQAIIEELKARIEQLEQNQK
jgi:trimeric autotransporter adhesin